MEPSYQREMRVSEECSRGRRELIVTGFLLAEIEPLAAILGGRFTLNLDDLVIAAEGAANDSIRPAHVLDVVKALFVSRKLYEDFRNADWLGMDSLCHDPTLARFAICVK